MSCVCSIIESGEMGFKNSFLIVPEDLPPMIITLFFLSYYFQIDHILSSLCHSQSTLVEWSFLSILP